jgi:hypothetical protein
MQLRLVMDALPVGRAWRMAPVHGNIQRFSLLATAMLLPYRAMRRVARLRVAAAVLYHRLRVTNRAYTLPLQPSFHNSHLHHSVSLFFLHLNVPIHYTPTIFSMLEVRTSTIRWRVVILPGFSQSRQNRFVQNINTEDTTARKTEVRH